MSETEPQSGEEEFQPELSEELVKQSKIEPSVEVKIEKADDTEISNRPDFDREAAIEHIREKDAAKVLTEMLRVTKKGGKVMIFPTYRSLRNQYPFATREILADNLIDRLKCAITNHQTLVIKKDPALKTEEWERAVADLAQSVRLPKLLEKLERLYMKIRLLLKGDVRKHK